MLFDDLTCSESEFQRLGTAIVIVQSAEFEMMRD